MNRIISLFELDLDVCTLHVCFVGPELRVIIKVYVCVCLYIFCLTRVLNLRSGLYYLRLSNLEE